MKKLKITIFICAILFSTNRLSFSQTDSALSKKINELTISVNKLVEIMPKSSTENSANKKDSLQKLNTEEISKFNFWNMSLVYLPIVLFIILVYIVAQKLKKEKFTLAEALSADEPMVESESTSQDGTVTKKYGTKFQNSASRLIAFLTGISAFIFTISLTSFSIYTYIKEGTMPDLGRISDLLWTFGIGIIPYASKQLSPSSNK